MFVSNSKLTTLDLSSFTIDGDTETEFMFADCGNENPFTVKYDSSKWNIDTSSNNFQGGRYLIFQNVN